MLFRSAMAQDGIDAEGRWRRGESLRVLSRFDALLAPTQITLTRPIDFNETQLLAKEQEEALLYKDMQTDLVQQMMRRIAAVKTAGVSLPPPPAANPPSAPAVPIL